MSKKQFCDEYYIGLDIGTGSVGWAVTDTEYKIPNFNGKAMWGARLFNSAQTAKERRGHRTARRRLKRRRERLAILEELFAEEIGKIDPTFFMRLKESDLYLEDKSVKSKHVCFDDIVIDEITNESKKYTDKEFQEKYPTIYHLRKALATESTPKDIRMVYLAIHHILKYRGNFLYEGEIKSAEDVDVIALIKSLVEFINDNIVKEEIIGLQEQNLQLVKETLSSDQNISNKKKSINKVFDYSKLNKSICENWGNLLAGGKVQLSNLFDDDNYKETDIKSIEFGKNELDEKEGEYRTVLGDLIEGLQIAKQIYDWGILQKILKGKDSISQSKIATFEEHESELKQLKSAIKELCPKEKNRVLGKPVKDEPNYSAYIGNFSSNGENCTTEGSIEKGATQEDFNKWLKDKIFKKIWAEFNEKYPQLAANIETGKAFPLQRNKDNGVLPYQLHKAELDLILKNASEYLPFLNEYDEVAKCTTADKIKMLLTFRIPYYVGPLNRHNADKGNGTAWSIRKDAGKVYPWNFDEKIDSEASAEAFIRRMTNKCTYLSDQDVLPKQSLLYSKFVALNELNNLKIGNKKVENKIKQEIFNDVIMQNNSITKKRITNYLIAKGYIPKNEANKEAFAITGVDNKLTSTMKVYNDFKKAFEVDTLTSEQEEIAEFIIYNSLLFGEDKKLLESRIKKEYGDKLPSKLIKKFVNMKFTGWGRLSKKFLTQIKGVQQNTDQTPRNIISAMWENEENPNLMQLLSNDYTYMKQLDELSLKLNEGRTISEMLDDMYVSPAVKRSINQTVKIIKELTGILGKHPAKICIEMARAEGEKKRTKTRKSQLQELYKACLKDISDWEQYLGKDYMNSVNSELDASEDNQLQAKKIISLLSKNGAMHV